MFIDPKKIAFETREDIVDYVSRGFLPPPKSHFDQVMDKVRNPDENDETISAKKGKEVVIPKTIIKEDAAILENILTRVYKNRIRNRNITLAGLGTLATGVIIGMIKCGINNRDRSDLIEEEYDYVDEKGHKVKVIHF